jgi:hypothetical protein
MNVSPVLSPEAKSELTKPVSVQVPSQASLPDAVPAVQDPHPRKRRSRWTARDDVALLNGVMHHGLDWQRQDRSVEVVFADWFSLGLLVGKVACDWDGPWGRLGQVSTDPVASRIPVKELVDKVIDPAQVGASGYNPKEDEYFQTQLRIELLETRFSINEFHID